MAASTFQWALRAFQQHGNLWIEWSTTAPFRAQQGQISVYKGTTFPPNPQNDRVAWSWDNEHKPLWDTGQRWGSDWCIAWIAQASPNGPYVYVTSLITAGMSNPSLNVCE